MVLRIFKMIVTSSYLTALECRKFVFGRGCVPDPTGGAYSTPPDLLAGLRGTNSKLRGEGEKKGRSDTGPPIANSWISPCKAKVYRHI